MTNTTTTQLPVQAGDMVRFLKTLRDYDYGYVIEVHTSDPDGPFLTLDTCPGGLTYVCLDDVERVDMPRVEVGQVWISAKTGTKIEVREPAWMNKPGSQLIWETKTLTRGRWVGTVILAAPAWRLEV